MQRIYLIAVVAVLTGCAVPKFKQPSHPYDPYVNLRDASIRKIKTMSLVSARFLLTNSVDALIEASKLNILNSLKDPDSAQFRNIQPREFQGGMVVCGEVNAKNSYGGYVGYTKFAASQESHELISRSYSNSKEENDAYNAGVLAACT